MIANHADLIRQVGAARQYTTIAGTIVVHFVECPTCGSMPTMRCKAIYNSGQETYGIHVARSRAAAKQLEQLTPRLDVAS